MEFHEVVDEVDAGEEAYTRAFADAKVRSCACGS